MEQTIKIPSNYKNLLEEIADLLIKNGGFSYNELSTFFKQKIKLDSPNFQYILIDKYEQKPNSKFLTSIHLNDLKIKSKVTEINASFKIKIDSLDFKEHYIRVLTIGDNITQECNLYLKPEFKEKISEEILFNKEYLAEGIIRYSPLQEFYTIHKLKIFTYVDAFNLWKNNFSKIASTNSPTLERRAEYILKIFGLNYDTLTPAERSAILLRLVPLVTKKYLLVDITKPQVGKSYIYFCLGYNLYTTNVTRSSAFVDGRNKKKGDFFCETEAYIVDEIGKINDPDFITAIQVYKNGEKNRGEIQSGIIKERSSNSIILLGNPKIPVDYSKVFENKINLFKDTIIDKTGDAPAFLDRVDGMPLSYQCRPFNDLMKTTDGIIAEKLELFREIIPVLREKTLNIEAILNRCDIRIPDYTSRCKEAIFKTLEGLIKILYPETIDTFHINKDDLSVLFNLARASRQFVIFQKEIIEEKESLSSSPLTETERIVKSLGLN